VVALLVEPVFCPPPLTDQAVSVGFDRGFSGIVVGFEKEWDTDDLEVEER